MSALYCYSPPHKRQTNVVDAANQAMNWLEKHSDLQLVADKSIKISRKMLLQVNFFFRTKNRDVGIRFFASEVCSKHRFKEFILEHDQDKIIGITFIK